MLAHSLAARDGGEALLLRLLDATPSALWATDSDGNTLLHHAFRYDRRALAAELVKRGLDPWSANNAGLRPVDFPRALEGLPVGPLDAPSSASLDAPSEPRTSYLQTEAGGARPTYRGAAPASLPARATEEDGTQAEEVPWCLLNSPDDVVIEIMKHLPLRSVLSLFEASHRFRRLSGSALLWEHLCWAHLKLTQGRRSCLASWREAYVEHVIMQSGVKLLRDQREEAKGRGEHVRRHMSSSIAELLT